MSQLLPNARHLRTLPLAPLVALLLALLPFLFLGACTDTASDTPRRVLLITIDTLRADHLGFYGYPRPTSPFLDSLAERSLVFDHAFASCSHTAPSHASLFTALHPAQHRLLQNGEPLNPSLLTLAQVYRDAGYRTAGFTPVQFLKELRLGFDHFEVEQRFQPAPTILGNALAWMREQPKRQPLFLWIHLFDVHQWINDRHIVPETLEEIVNSSPLTRDQLLAFLREEHGAEIDEPSIREKLPDTVDRYDGQMLATDRALESFYQALQGEGLAGDDAVWVITSDHGEGLGNHGYMGHGKYVYDEQIRVPLLVHFADGRFAPQRLEGLVELVDVGATLAEVAGSSFVTQAVPASGRSFLHQLDPAGSPWARRGVFAQRRPADARRKRQGWTPGEVFALRTERFKVIARTEDTPEIYDLATDPFELENLASDDAADSETEPGRLLEQLERRWAEMLEQGERVGAGEINPEYLEELKALGYL